MTSVLVTGATGFVGRQSIEPLLARGYAVHSVSRSSARMPAGVEHHIADLLDPAQRTALVARIRPRRVLHLAWYAVPGAYKGSEENLRWVEASLGLARDARQNGCDRFVAAGTCAEYDWSGGVCRERETPLEPATLYGASKHGLQVALAAWGAQHGVAVAWGRLFFLYGPHEAPERLVASVIRAGIERRESPCSIGTQIRDFQHVADAGGAFAAVLASDVIGPINIASGHGIPVSTLVNQIADQLDSRDLIRLGARPLPATEPAILAADVSRLQHEVGWRDGHTLETGIADAISWWRREVIA